MATISPCLENSLGCWIPRHQSDSWQPHGVCLIVVDEGNGNVSGFDLFPLGGPELPYFQSSYPLVWERSCIVPSPHSHVPSIVPSLRSIVNIITVADSGRCFPLTTTLSAPCTVWCPPHSPVFGSFWRSCKSLFFSQKTQTGISTAVITK
jgi:hypothetical protein